MSDIPLDGSEFITLTLGDAPAPRLDKALADAAPEGAGLSRSKLGKLIAAGAVARAGGEVVTDAKTKGAAGEVFEVRLPKPPDAVAQPEAIAIDVIYEDADLIVVNKAAGMVVHPAPGSETGTLVNALLHHFGDTLSGVGGTGRPGIVHRIDKDTSGLLVVAKTDAAHQGLAAQFAAHTVRRHYTAFCIGAPDAGDPRLRGLPGVAFEQGGVMRIATNIARHKTDRKRMAVVTQSGRHAITRLRAETRFGPVERAIAAKVDCWLETGRTHQIRVHLAHCGHGLIGDPIYGTRRQLRLEGAAEDARAVLSGFSRQALHARTLGFTHPVTGEEVDFTSDLPEDLVAVEQALATL